MRLVRVLTLFLIFSFIPQLTHAADIAILGSRTIEEAQTILYETEFALDRLSSCDKVPLEYRTDFERLSHELIIIEVLDMPPFDTGGILCGYAFLHGSSIYLMRHSMPFCGRLYTIAHEMLHLIGMEHNNEAEHKLFDDIVVGCLAAE